MATLKTYSILENLPIALKIDKIKLYNTQGLKLKLDLMFKFVNL